MSWQDRDYARSGYDQRSGPMSGMRFVWPRLSPVTKKILIANAAVFILPVFWRDPEFVGFFHFSLPEATSGFQLWRFVTYQYFHGNMGHIFINMVALYFAGPLLEQRWPGRKFFLLYTLFGVAGAVLYALTVALNFFDPAPMVGASGSVLGLIGACAVTLPQVKVFLVIPIRTFTVIFAVIFVLNVITSSNGADACHLGGLLFGAVWVWLENRGVIKLTGRPGGTIGPSGRKWVHTRIRKGAWEKKMKRRQIQQGEIDRILKKIHDKGLASLSSREKKILKSASRDRADYDNGFPPDPAQDN